MPSLVTLISGNLTSATSLISNRTIGCVSFWTRFDYKRDQLSYESLLVYQMKHLLLIRDILLRFSK